MENSCDEERVIGGKVTDEMTSDRKGTYPGSKVFAGATKRRDVRQATNGRPELGSVLLPLMSPPLQFGVIEDIGDILTGGTGIDNT